VDKNLFEEENKLSYLIREEHKEILVAGLLISKVKEALKKIEERTVKSKK
jgi:hypothetical protein